MKNIKIIKTNVLVIGSGASGLNACSELLNNNVSDILLVCQKVLTSTSYLTGSDKQTFYKLSLTGKEKDSIYDLAKSFVNGGSTHGDISLTLAANSAKAFFNLVNIGVPFPKNEFGEYVGYKTDHDNRKRATSCGPLTSKIMVEKLYEKVKKENLNIMENVKVTFPIIEDNTIRGVIAFSDIYIDKNNEHGLFIIQANDVIWATGGPSTIYYSSVYPVSTPCSFGYPIYKGANCANLTESQYGIASVKFRWNLSGSYQQVIPRYISIDKNGKECEFLSTYLNDNYFEYVFKKGYEWPFSPEKKSSIIDLCVQAEIEKGNRVFLDFMHNPKGFDFDKIGKEAFTYLNNSDALDNTPIERLYSLNPKAIHLYKDHNIDLEKEYLEIAVCAQHINGGFDIDVYGESTNIHHLFFTGECAGTYGVKRPGGSALLATQVFSMRAVEKISSTQSTSNETNINIRKALSFFNKLKKGNTTCTDIKSKITELQKEFSNTCTILRNKEKVEILNISLQAKIARFFDEIKPDSHNSFILALDLFDILLTQYAISSSILNYICDDGKSRGAYIISDKEIKDLLSNSFIIDTKHNKKVSITHYKNGIKNKFINTRPIPQSEQWFEKVYNK